MKRFLKDQCGNALLWPLFMMLILFTLSFVIYTAVIVSSKYQACENDLQRSATIAVDKSMENANIRDIVLDIPVESAEDTLETNLREMGYSKASENTWLKAKDGKTLYSLEDMQVSIQNEILTITGEIKTYLPWRITGYPCISLPVRVVCRALYISG
jgi:flagellar basal body-associated protein FliL